MPNLPTTSPRRDTKAQVKEFTLAGLKPRQISLLTGVSTQRVYQLLNELRDAGEIERAS